MLILVNKPFGMICQFSPGTGHPTLADIVSTPGVYPAGRLDVDSEGLVVLTDDGRQQARISDPRHKLEKGYWVQVEGIPASSAIEGLSVGVDLGDFMTRPAVVRAIPEPSALWPRVPPIRMRQAIPTAWLDIRIREGRNRQVRRMTARVGLPTLRLIRYCIGPWSLDGLRPGEWRESLPLPPAATGKGSNRQPQAQRPRYSR